MQKVSKKTEKTGQIEKTNKENNSRSISTSKEEKTKNQKSATVLISKKKEAQEHKVKKARTAYNLFQAEMRPILAKEKPQITPKETMTVNKF